MYLKTICDLVMCTRDSDLKISKIFEENIIKQTVLLCVQVIKSKTNRFFFMNYVKPTE